MHITINLRRNIGAELGVKPTIDDDVTVGDYSYQISTKLYLISADPVLPQRRKKIFRVVGFDQYVATVMQFQIHRLMTFLERLAVSQKNRVQIRAT